MPAIMLNARKGETKETVYLKLIALPVVLRLTDIVAHVTRTTDEHEVQGVISKGQVDIGLLAPIRQEVSIIKNLITLA